MKYDDGIEAELKVLVQANRILAHEGIVDDFGHISVRNPKNPERFFISRAISPARVSREDIHEYALDGSPVSDMGDNRPYAERVIHAAIFEARPDVMSVCHHHAAAMLPFASSDAVLRPVYHLGAVLGGPVPVWDSHAEFGDTSMLVNNMDMARSLARALGNGPFVLLARHGTVVAGKGIRETVQSAIYGAENATIQQHAMSVGRVSYLTPGEIEKTAAINLGPLGVERSWPNRCARAGV